MSGKVAVLEPIPVTRNGIQFRSTLEARWSVVLCELGVAWIYEPKLWNLPSGRYLPDFYLSDCNVWLEVKGVPVDDPRHRELGAAAETLVVITGDPWPGSYTCRLYTQEGVETNLRLALGRRNHAELWLCRIQDGWSYPLSREVNGDFYPLFDCCALREAYRAASQALFETVAPRSHQESRGP